MKLYSISECGVIFDGEFPTKEKAVAEGLALFKDSEYFWVGVNRKPFQPEDGWDAEDWINNVAVQDDYTGEYAEDWGYTTEEQRAELNAQVRPVLARWLDRHNLRPTHFLVDEIEKILIADAPDTAGRVTTLG